VASADPVSQEDVRLGVRSPLLSRYSLLSEVRACVKSRMWHDNSLDECGGKRPYGDRSLQGCSGAE
jgi:hypothetical protein